MHLPATEREVAWLGLSSSSTTVTCLRAYSYSTCIRFLHSCLPEIFQLHTYKKDQPNLGLPNPFTPKPIVELTLFIILTKTAIRNLSKIDDDRRLWEDIKRLGLITYIQEIDKRPLYKYALDGATSEDFTAAGMEDRRREGGETLDRTMIHGKFSNPDKTEVWLATGSPCLSSATSYLTVASWALTWG